MAMQLFFLHNDEMSTWRLFKFIEVKMDGAGMEGNYFSMKWMVVRPLRIFLYKIRISQSGSSVCIAADDIQSNA